MKVGINGMGRMGRLALRAAFGGLYRPPDDPRRDNRLEVIHANEIKGGAAAIAHMLEFDSMHGRWHTAFEVDGVRQTITLMLPVPLMPLPYTETITTDEPAGTHSTPTPKGPQPRQLAMRTSAGGASAPPLTMCRNTWLVARSSS